MASCCGFVSVGHTTMTAILHQFYSLVLPYRLVTLVLSDRVRLCGRFWSIDTTVISKLARGERASQPSVMAHSLQERKGNHLQVCGTRLRVSVCLHVYADEINLK